MPLTPTYLAILVSWIATGLGLGLWGWSLVREKNAIRKLRFFDCGVVLIFSAILVRVVAQERQMNALDWGWVFLSPLFIVAALWRLARTACPGDYE
jgi:sulfite exporter TauE/SafE